MRILVDADACPGTIKDLLYKTAERLKLQLILVANQSLLVPPSEYIQNIVVAAGPDEADNHIVDILEEGDLVISADIPLADRIVKKGSLVLDPRGSFFTPETIGQRLAVRNLMDDLRTEGMQTGGAAPFSNKDKQKFAAELDKFLTKALRKR